MFTVKEIIDCTGAKLIRGSVHKTVSGVSIDSRIIKPGELFIAIAGERFNGHSFIEQAILAGAGAVLLSEASSLAYSDLNSTPIIKVNDTTLALAGLAYRHRSRFKIPVIAVTGSNGKTTTKEMLSALLSTKFKILRNLGTQNNHIGVPMTILGLTQQHQCAVVEMGANHFGEIDRLSWILQPDFGIITNIGPSHLQFFGSLEGVFEAKMELTKNLAPQAKLIINKDDQFLSQIQSRRFKLITFGLESVCDFSARIIKQTAEQIHFLLNEKDPLVLNTIGYHNVYNALASIACARSLGVEMDGIKEALTLFKTPPMRMQLLNLNNVKVINDCYNSNPGSLGRAIEFLREYSSPGRKIVVCGDMLELGMVADKLHAEIGKKIAAGQIDFLITVGTLAKNIAAGANSAGMPQGAIHSCGNTEQAANLLRELVGSGDTVLIKGSRSMKMEDVLDCFTNFSIR